MAGYATDTLKNMPTQYGGRGGEYDFEGDQVAGAPTSAICGRMLQSIMSVSELWRIYHFNPIVGKAGVPREKGLIGHYAPFYRGWDLNIRMLIALMSGIKNFRVREEWYIAAALHHAFAQRSYVWIKKRCIITRAYVAQNDSVLV